MAIETNIEWCDSTINPTSGCEGCELWNGRDIRHCYAGPLHENWLAKSYPDLYAEDFQEVRLIPGRMMQAARWPDLRGKRRPQKPWLDGLPRHIFVGDMGDFCSRSVPEEYIVDEIIGAIRSVQGQRSFWLLLTKQIRRLAEISEHIGGLPDNSMAMTSVTDQARTEQRILWLLKVRCKWRGISVEPLLGSVDLTHIDYTNQLKAILKVACERDGLPNESATYKPGSATIDALNGEWFDGWDRGHGRTLDWVICGGESGPEARPMHPDWARSIRDQCQAAGVPFFFKQWGAFAPIRSPQDNGLNVYVNKDGTIDDVSCMDSALDPALMHLFTKKAAGHLLDGKEWHEYPVAGERHGDLSRAHNSVTAGSIPAPASNVNPANKI